MTIGSILLGLALLVGVGLFVTRPLFVRDPHRRRRMNEYQALQAQKEAVLVEIRALDFDYETGKVAEEEYQLQREAYVTEAAELLMQIDALNESYLETEPAAAPERKARPADDEIEAAIARRRAKVAAASSKPKKASPDGRLADGGFCPQCGQPADAGDRFCAHCGHQLIQPQHA